MNRQVRDQLLLVRMAAEQARSAVLAAAADPAEPAVARAAYRQQVEAAAARLSRLVRWRPRRHWRTAAVVRRWLDYAVMAHFYRVEPYRPAEQALWAAIERLPDIPVRADDRRRLRDQLEDAQVLADYALRDRRAGVTRAAVAYNTARRRVSATRWRRHGPGWRLPRRSRTPIPPAGRR